MKHLIRWYGTTGLYLDLILVLSRRSESLSLELSGQHLGLASTCLDKREKIER